MQSNRAPLARTLAVAVPFLLLGLGAGALWRASGQQPEAAGRDAGAAPHAAHASPATGAGTPTSRPAAPSVSAGDPPDEIVLDVTNPSCPVMGGQTDHEVHAEWEGLRVRFCCPGCEGQFLQEPARFLSDLGVDHESARTALDRYREAGESERRDLLEELQEVFTVHAAGEGEP